MAIKITECACCGNRDSTRFIQKSDGYICKTCGVWFRYETEEEKSGCMDGRRRLKNYRFDDARETFMEVLDKYPESIDALWGSLLARYGIVFVKGFFDDTSEPIYCFPEYDEYGGRRFRDERAYKRIMALLEERNEDFRLSDFYESKAKEIDRAISKYSECKKNTDVDIFICVKISAATEEAPQASGRTADYEYALKVYEDLKKRGVNAFFSFVTLKNNVESDDLIWVNLVKSKKMLIIGSAEEYLDSVWVKSEWKRWLYLGREKDLYICSMKHDNEYPKSILPRELASLHPQVYTLDTYEKMIDELCEDIVEAPVPEVIRPSYEGTPASMVITAKPETSTASVLGKQDGKITFTDGHEEALEYGVREIRVNAYKNNTDIVHVVLPESVKKIGISAFAGCSSLESITIPQSVKSIEGWAFKECDSLTDITIPGSVTSISPSCFWGCTELSSVTIENGVESIDNQAFYGCTSLTKIVIPESVSFIGNGVFTGCTSLESITMPKNITSTIGNAIFDKCKKLKKITLPEGATAIDGWAFQDCGNLAEINIPETVTSIGTGAFWNCSQIKSINIPKSVTSIAEKAFAGCMGLRDVYYSGTEAEWKKIAIGEENTRLKEVKVHFAVKSEPAKSPKTAATAPADKRDGKIVYKDGHEEVLEWGMTEISGCAYKDNTNIVSVVLPNSVTAIKGRLLTGGAFHGCSNLESITIPDSVTYIGEASFAYCTNLKVIDIPNSVISIGNWAFAHCKSLVNVTIPDSVTEIGYHAFCECHSLVSINISKNIPKVSDSAFYACNSLTNITIPDSVTEIGEHAFCLCRNLESITIPHSVSSIESSAFSLCKSLVNVTIPDSVTKIDYHTFSACHSLTSINIPKSVTNIAARAFDECNNLKDIYYSGSSGEWKQIRIDPVGNKKLVSLFGRPKIHYNCK